ncbi:hypothetical protein, partial [Klebsiella quasipneumoniae]|uniref:hypothetical protein n=1 Tax=Klebsiella quasipneumoniae TaxID=1463165 RepID=UPI0027322B3F
DTQAADSRLLQPHPSTGNLRLADSHYGMFGVPGEGSVVWTEVGAIDWFGDASKAGQPIDFVNDAYLGMCDDLPEFCATGEGGYAL